MDKKLEKLYRKALKEVAKDAREISGGKIAPHLRVATKSHAEQLAKSRLRLGLGSPSPSAYDLGRRKAKEHIDTYLPHSSADQARWFRENIRDSEETLKIRDKKGLPTQFESAFLKTLIEAEKKHTFGSPLPSTKSGKKTAKTCKHCDEKSLPGLKITPGLCQYHWNAGNWGKEWADKCRTDAQGKKPKALGYKHPGASRDFLDGYLEAALWSSYDNSDDSGGEPLDRNYSLDDFTKEALRKAKKDCDAFVKDNQSDLNETGASDSRNGHDFWLTREGHGAGFWDRGYGAIGERLTKAAEVYGDANIYVSRGRVHFG